MAWCPADRNSAQAPRLERALLLVALLRLALALPLVVRASPVERSQVLRAVAAPS